MSQSSLHPDSASDRPSAEPSAASSGTGDSADDQLGHLYKMSRTAGLGSGDYVAINPMAVAAVIFGVASILAIVDDLLLVIPAVGLLLGIVALKQIRGSNGTQTGGALSIIALVLCAGFIGGRVVQGSLVAARERADRDAINDLVHRFGQDMRDMKLDDAYAMCDAHFTDRITKAQFEAVLKARHDSQFIGPIESVESNGLIKFDPDPDTGLKTMASGVSVVKYERQDAGETRWGIAFRKIGGKWVIDDLPSLFPPTQQRPTQNTAAAPALSR